MTRQLEMAIARDPRALPPGAQSWLDACLRGHLEDHRKAERKCRKAHRAWPYLEAANWLADAHAAAANVYAAALTRVVGGEAKAIGGERG